jgi:hypothetical protein
MAEATAEKEAAVKETLANNSFPEIINASSSEQHAYL